MHNQKKNNTANNCLVWTVSKLSEWKDLFFFFWSDLVQESFLHPLHTVIINTILAKISVEQQQKSGSWAGFRKAAKSTSQGFLYFFFPSRKSMSWSRISCRISELYFLSPIGPGNLVSQRHKNQNREHSRAQDVYWVQVSDCQPVMADIFQGQVHCSSYSVILLPFCSMHYDG